MRECIDEDKTIVVDVGPEIPDCPEQKGKRYQENALLPNSMSMMILMIRGTGRLN